MKPILTGVGMVFLLLLTVVNHGCKKDNSSSMSNSQQPSLQLVTDGLVSPVALVEPPDGTKRLFVVDELGQIWIIGADGKKLPTPFIDISSARWLRLDHGDPTMNEGCWTSPSLLISKQTVSSIYFIRPLPDSVCPYPGIRDQAGIT